MALRGGDRRIARLVGGDRPAPLVVSRVGGGAALQALVASGLATMPGTAAGAGILAALQGSGAGVAALRAEGGAALETLAASGRATLPSGAAGAAMLAALGGSGAAGAAVGATGAAALQALVGSGQATLPGTAAGAALLEVLQGSGAATAALAAEGGAALQALVGSGQATLPGTAAGAALLEVLQGSGAAAAALGAEGGAALSAMLGGGTADRADPTALLSASGMWLSSTRGVTDAGGGAVSAWVDQCAAPVTFSQGVGASRPQLNATPSRITFDGVDDFLSAASAAKHQIVDAFYWSGWVRVLSAPSNDFTLWAQWDASDVEQLIIRNHLSSGRGDADRFEVVVAESGVSSATAQFDPLPLTGWVFVEVIYDGSELTETDRVRVFYDGVEATRIGGVGTIPASVNSATAAAIIAAFQGSANYSNIDVRNLYTDLSIPDAARRAALKAFEPPTLTPVELLSSNGTWLSASRGHALASDVTSWQDQAGASQITFTAPGDAPTYTAGPPALVGFNGSTEYLQAANAAKITPTTSFYWYAWMRDTTTQERNFWSSWDGANVEQWQFGRVAAGNRVLIAEDAFTFGYLTFPALDTADFHFVEIVYNGLLSAGNRLKVYYDRVEQTSVDSSGTIPASVFATTPSAYIAAYQGTSRKGLALAQLGMDLIIPSDAVRDMLFAFEAPV